MPTPIQPNKPTGPTGPEAEDNKKEDSKKLPRGTEPRGVLAESETLQDKELAEKGIYQPYDKAFNRAQASAESNVNAEGDDEYEDHRKNLAHLPPVPSESAGAASQAK